MNKLSSRNQLIVYGILGLILIALGAYIVSNNYVVKVGSHKISKQEITGTSNILTSFYEQAEEDYSTKELELEAANRLVDRYIVAKYAEENEIIITDEQVEAYYQQRLTGYADEETLLSEVEKLYGIDKQEYLEELAYDLLRDAVVNDLEQDYSEWLASQRDALGVDIKL